VRGHGGTVVEAPAEKPKRQPKATAAPEPKTAPKSKPAEPKKPRVTNGERLAEMAEWPEGFTIEDITKMLGVLSHTARALISIELRKRRGLNVVIDRETKRYRVAT